MDTNPTVLIATRIEQARKEAGVSILGLSTATGIPRSTLKRFLVGSSDPTLPQFRALAKALDADVSAWLEGIAA